MQGRAEWADRGTWITVPGGWREQVVETPLVEDNEVFVQTISGLYTVALGSVVEFFATEDGGI